MHEQYTQYLINRPVNFGAADVTEGLIPSSVPSIKFLNFWEVVMKRIRNIELLTITDQHFQLLSLCFSNSPSAPPFHQLIKSTYNIKPPRPKPLVY